MVGVLNLIFCTVRDSAVFFVRFCSFGVRLLVFLISLFSLVFDVLFCGEEVSVVWVLW